MATTDPAMTAAEVNCVASSPQYRTAFHFQPPKNWINDPNGPMYYKGIYHLFYQYNPDGPQWGNIVWGHAVSSDLVNWTLLPPALARDKPHDTQGCWSGSATILQDNRPVLFYTGGNKEKHQLQLVAVPEDLSDLFLTRWMKPHYNPVIVPANGIDPFNFRDPTTGWLGHDEHWRVLVGGMVDGQAKALVYKSKNFMNWVQTSILLCNVDVPGMLECLDFYPVRSDGGKQGVEYCTLESNGDDVKHIFKISVARTFSDHYVVGRYLEEDDVFVPDDGKPIMEGQVGLLRYDHGLFYASKVFFDAGKQRRVVWAWVDELDGKESAVAKGWAGVQSIPRAVWLHKAGGKLIQWPVEEVESLRKQVFELANTDIKMGEMVEINGLNAAQADVEVDFHLDSLENVKEIDPICLENPQKLSTQNGPFVPGGIGPFGLLVLASHDLKEYTAVYFRIFKAADKYVTLMSSDQSKSSLRSEVSKPTYAAFMDIDIKERRCISLRTLIDHSMVESFGDKGRTCITTRAYPTAMISGDTHLFVFNEGSSSVRANLKAWDMAEADIK